MPGEAEACFFIGPNGAKPNGKPSARLHPVCMPNAGVVDVEGFVLDHHRPCFKKLKPKALHTLNLGLGERLNAARGVPLVPA